MTGSKDGQSSVKSLWDQLLRENTSKFRRMEHQRLTLRRQLSPSTESLTVLWNKAEWLNKPGISKRTSTHPRRACSLCQLFKVWIMHNLLKNLIPIIFGVKTLKVNWQKNSGGMLSPLNLHRLSETLPMIKSVNSNLLGKNSLNLFLKQWNWKVTTTWSLLAFQVMKSTQMCPPAGKDLHSCLFMPQK